MPPRTAVTPRRHLKPRPSPSVSATSLPVGTRRRGGDGTMWTITETSTGIRRWRKPTVIKNGSTKNSRKVASVSHKILFCEPCAVRSVKDLNTLKFVVSDKFYPTLLRAPRMLHDHTKERGGCNAYVFGRRFPLASYQRLGYCGNDRAQIGFIDLGLFKVKADLDAVDDRVSEIFGHIKHGDYLPWEDRAALKRVRKAVPYILFLGDTDGGDVGATLYAHKTAGHIDGLIVDNHYFFPYVPTNTARAV